MSITPKLFVIINENDEVIGHELIDGMLLPYSDKGLAQDEATKLNDDVGEELYRVMELTEIK